MSPYVRLGLMIVTSMLVMYGITYLTSYEIIGHARFSETRAFVTILMGSAMAVVMIAFMWPMYGRVAVNMATIAAAIAVFALSLYLVRSQATVDDVDYMEAMIPHHSIAILTSRRAQISDPRVRELADRIIDAQEREIAEMNAPIRDLRGVAEATPGIDGR